MNAEEWFQKRKSELADSVIVLSEIVTDESYQLTTKSDIGSVVRFSYPIQQVESLREEAQKKGWQLVDFMTFSPSSMHWERDYMTFQRRNVVVPFFLEKSEEFLTLRLDSEFFFSAEDLYLLTMAVKQWVLDKSKNRMQLMVGEKRFCVHLHAIDKLPYIKRKLFYSTLPAYYLGGYIKREREALLWLDQHTKMTLHELEKALQSGQTPETIRDALQRGLTRFYSTR